SLAREMVGRDVLLRVDKAPAEAGDVLLSVEDLHVSDDRGIEKVRGVSLDVRAGEIVGIAGVDGNSQTELIDAIAGLQKIDIRGGGPLTRAGGLSGGNQQKVVAAREIARDPKVLIAAQPTRGLDVGAIEYLHQRLVAERDKGRAVLLISLELEEIFSLSDQILVMYEGEIVGEHAGEVSEEEIGLEMLGGREKTAA